MMNHIKALHLLLISLLWLSNTLSALESEFIPKEGWEITTDQPENIPKQGWDDIPYKKESKHFIIYSDVSQKATEDIARHLEIWYKKVARPMLGSYFEEPLKEKKRRVIFWAYLDAARDFHGFENVNGYAAGYEARCTNINHIHDDERPPKKGEKAIININGLQHEATHVLTNLFKGDCMPLSFGEGIAELLGNAPYQYSLKENLNKVNEEYKTCLFHISQMYLGISSIKWIPTKELLSTNKFEWGGTVYQQGCSLMQFLLTDKTGRKLWKSFMTKNKTLNANPQTFSTRTTITPLSDKQVAALQKYWYCFIEAKTLSQFSQLSNVKKLPLTPKLKLSKKSSESLVFEKDINRKKPLILFQDTDGFFKYKELFRREKVFVIHPPAHKEPGAVDFSNITESKKGKLVIEARDHPAGNVNIVIRQNGKQTVRKHLNTDGWEKFIVKFDHEPVLIEIVADDWYNEFCFLTYEIK